MTGLAVQSSAAAVCQCAATVCPPADFFHCPLCSKPQQTDSSSFHRLPQHQPLPAPPRLLRRLNPRPLLVVATSIVGTASATLTPTSTAAPYPTASTTSAPAGTASGAASPSGAGAGGSSSSVAPFTGGAVSAAASVSALLLGVFAAIAAL